MTSRWASTDSFVADVRRCVDRRLSDLLAAPAAAPPSIVEALRYAVLGGGKRLRPLLVVASGEACDLDPSMEEDGPSALLLTAACAVELIHTFSLIHDDLPSLDNDSLRRGRPTLHVKFDEATAVLAGDALLNLAYGILCRGRDLASVRLRVMSVISRSVGLEGMISGQILDLASQAARIDAGALDRMHGLKTGALISASCEAGAIVARAPDEMIGRLRDFGAHLGLAFQITDDILDVEGTSRVLGKSAGKDVKADKATFPALWGLAESRRRAADAVERACEAVSGLGGSAGHLRALARGVVTRNS